MGCGTSKASQPKPAPARARAATRSGSGGVGGGYKPQQPSQQASRPYVEQNGSLTSYDRRLSLVSEGSEDELRCNELLQGNVSMARDDTSRVVRVFTSSTFTDTRHERNALMERVYPRLKDFTLERGYDFQVVDMRWGLREAATDDHMTTELCMRELRACQRLSTGPNFVTFLSHKYGYRPLSRLINADQFEMVLPGVSDPNAKQLLQKWYVRDDNAVPPSYVLQPISTHLPGFTSKVPDVFNTARDTWWRESDTMREALSSAAKRTLTDSAESHKFLTSVTEKEIDAGILQAQDPEEHCLWFKRKIEGIDKQEPSKLLSRFTECQGSNKTIEESSDLLRNLRENLLPKKLPNDCVISYSIPWTKKAIDPSNCRAHAEYIDQLCSDFEFHLKDKIQQAINKQNQSQIGTDTITQEVSQHALFCQKKIELFQGRQSVIDKIENYLLTIMRYPLVIHGASGCGKTSIMAVAAERAWELYKGKALVILRFIGTTPDSSNVRTLLFSIITQIRRVFQDEKPVPTDMKELVEEFHTVLHLASAEQPIIIVLDSLDQFSHENNARQLFWLPSKLPRHVKMLLSTLPADEYECFPRLKMILQKAHHFLVVPDLTTTDVNSILTAWLEKGSRSLRPQQRQLLMDAFSQCQLPLYLRLCYDEACRWPSYLDVSESHLEKTVQDIIHTLFSRIERSHGKLFVSRVLGYITLSRSGLSEMELQDVLSCDDDVLSDVYQFWTPPLRRLPPLLAIRVKADLSQYLVERGAESVTVTYWFHRQFIEVARTSYCANRQTVKIMHAHLSEYFRGVWASKAKPYTDPNTGEETAALRYVAKQPFRFDTRFNLRKLMELPVHVVQSEQLSVLKEELLCNLKWLTTKMEATSLRHVLDDFNMARLKFPDDEDLKTVGEALQLSQEALNVDPHQLPGQLLGRISHGNNRLTAQCCRPHYPALIPSTVVLQQPGGQLLHVMSEHSNEVNALDLSKDGRFAVTCSDDHTVKLWDVQAGKLYKSIDNVGDQPSFLRFCCNDECVVVVDSNHVYLIRLETSQVKVIDENNIQLSGANVYKFLVFNGGSTLAVPVQTGIAFLELPSGLHQYTVTDQFLKPRGTFGSFSDILDGHKNFIAITGSANVGSTLHHEVHILDVREQTFTHCVSLFLPPQNEDDAEYTVDALAMTHDETLVIAAEMLENNLHFISVQTGQVIKKLEGNPGDSSDLFHITPDDKFLYFCNIDKLCVWNLETGERSYTLHHSSRAADIQTRDGLTYVSISIDVVCIWDITRTDVHQLADSERSPYQICSMKELPQTDRYILVKKVSSKEADLPCLICIYDVLQEEYIRTIKWPHSLQGQGVMHVTDDDRVITVYERSIIVINIKDSTHRVCQGRLPRFNTDICLLKNKPWFVTLTVGRLKLKVYNWLTGKVEFIMGADQNFKLEYFTVSPEGNVAVATGESYPLFVFDIATRSLRHKIFMNTDVYSPYEMKISSDGSLLVQSVDRFDEEGEISTSLDYAVLFDLKSGKPWQHLIDWEAYRRIGEEHTDDDIGINNFIVVRDQVVTSHYDHSVRVWSVKTGELVHWLPLSQAEDVSSMFLTPDETRLITLTQKEQLILWDTSSWHKVASYRMEAEMSFKHCVATGDGSLVLMRSETKGTLNQLRLVGNGIKPKRDQRRLKEIYKPNLKLDEKILVFEIPEMEPDDPDIEMEEVSGDESSDEDDNDASFNLNSDIPGLSQAKTPYDPQLEEAHDLDLDLSDSDQDDDYETKTRSTIITDSTGLMSSAKSTRSGKV